MVWADGEPMDDDDDIIMVNCFPDVNKRLMLSALWRAERWRGREATYEPCSEVFSPAIAGVLHAHRQPDAPGQQQQRKRGIVSLTYIPRPLGGFKLRAAPQGCR